MKQFLKLSVYVSLSVIFMACASSKESSKTEETKTAATQVDIKVPEKREKKEYNTKLDSKTKERISEAVSLGNAGNSQEAKRLLEEAVKSEPKAYAAHYNLGILSEREGKPQEAAVHYQKALESEIDFSPALINLVRLELREGKNALQTAERYIQLSPNNFEHQYAKLEALLGSGKDQEAIEIIRRLLKKDEASTRLRYYMGLGEYHLGRYLLSQYVIEQALLIETNDAELYLLKAMVELKLESPIKAQEAVDLALAINPHYFEALWLKGIMSYETRNIRQANEMFQRAMAENPGIPGMYLNLGNVLKTQGLGDEAEEKLKEAERLAPNDGDVLFSLGALYLSLDALKLKNSSGMDRLKLAKQYFEKAKAQWTNKEQKATADEFIAKTKRAEEILQAEIDAAELGDDPFADDPFGDNQAPEPTPGNHRVD